MPLAEKKSLDEKSADIVGHGTRFYVVLATHFFRTGVVISCAALHSQPRNCCFSTILHLLDYMVVMACTSNLYTGVVDSAMK
jgi:hypothetical protein